MRSVKPHGFFADMQALTEALQESVCVICVGGDPGVLRRPGCDHALMEHKGATAMARRIADRAYPHTAPQSLQ